MPPRANRGDRGGGRGGNARGDRGRGRGRGGPQRGGSPHPPSPAPAPGGQRRGGGPDPANRGTGRGRGRGQTVQVASQATTIAADSSVVPIGVRRPGFSNVGKKVPVLVNMFKMEISSGYIYQYDDMVGDKTLPVRRNMELFKQLQYEVAPHIFPRKVSYDGRKIMVSSYRLDIPNDYQEFQITIGAGTASKPPRVHRIKIKYASKINTELLTRFVEGKQSNDEEAITALQALNIVLRMEPTQRFPFNSRSFYVPEGKRVLAGGIELWRGYFQSVRPAMGKLLLNVDVSAGVMYQSGPLIGVCCSFLRRSNDPSVLARLGNRDWLALKRFLVGLKVLAGDQSTQRRPREIKNLSTKPANQLTFRMRREGQPETDITVAHYFQTVTNRPLSFPNLPCVEVGNGALLPLEICTVPPGQIMKKQVPPDATREMVDFSAQRPQERFAGIQEALGLLRHGQSDYVQQFGMSVDTTPLQIMSRTLPPPTMLYGGSSRESVKFGAWNMANKHFIKPMPLNSWAVMVLEQQNRFRPQTLRSVITGLKNAAQAGNMTPVADPMLECYRPAQQSITRLLDELQNEFRKKKVAPPQLIVIILPFNGDAIWAEAKHWGDILRGVATQCLKAQKCERANIQYWANVCLKINGKLGGINTIVDPEDPTNIAADVLKNPHERTLVLGADVIHPSPGSVGRPSFTAMVGSMDRHAAKYRATSRAQTSRQEIIDDFENMAKEMITANMNYCGLDEGVTGPARAPTKIIVYRDGVSEGQFKQVKEQGMCTVKFPACKALGVQAKITFIIVGKRHHMRMNPLRDADRSGNAPAGSVIDTDIAHPVEYDLFLQSHAGIKGTSRSAHYTVSKRDNGFRPEALERFTYNLCHVYARATRSVSIPAPTYYADIVCSRAKTHYGPNVDLSAASDTASSSAGQTTEASLRAGFQQVHATQKNRMYFQ
ncbi:Piwi-domain-containing protein [Schizophyllum commune Loenen D]|nr:Piwi-domain-containing protein [Schizophyllum commune Loenen D]